MALGPLNPLIYVNLLEFPYLQTSFGNLNHSEIPLGYEVLPKRPSLPAIYNDMGTKRPSKRFARA